MVNMIIDRIGEFDVNMLYLYSNPIILNFNDLLEENKLEDR